MNMVEHSPTARGRQLHETKELYAQRLSMYAYASEIMKREFEQIHRNIETISVSDTSDKATLKRAQEILNRNLIQTRLIFKTFHRAIENANKRTR